jgi:hypothetical protein
MNDWAFGAFRDDDEVAATGGISFRRNDPPPPAVTDSENGVTVHDCPANGSKTCLSACAGGSCAGVGGMTAPGVPALWVGASVGTVSEAMFCVGGACGGSV